MLLEIRAEIVSDVWPHVADFLTSSYFLLWMGVVSGATGRMIYWPSCEVEQVSWSQLAFGAGGKAWPLDLGTNSLLILCLW
jgi:hypothetical protein